MRRPEGRCRRARRSRQLLQGLASRLGPRPHPQAERLPVSRTPSGRTATPSGVVGQRAARITYRAQPSQELGDPPGTTRMGRVPHAGVAKCDPPPVHRVVVLVAFVASLAVGSGVGAAPTPVPSDTTLLRRHLPVLELHPAEGFPPVAVDAFLAASDPLVRRPDGTFTRRRPRARRRRGSTSGTAPWRRARPDRLLRRPRGGSAHGVRRGPPRAGRIVVQYWFFEPVNLWSPVVPAAANAWQAHEGDWEHIAIVLDARGDAAPGGVRAALPRRAHAVVARPALREDATAPRLRRPGVARVVPAAGRPGRPTPGAGRIRRSSSRSSARSGTGSSTMRAAGADHRPAPRRADVHEPRVDGVRRDLGRGPVRATRGRDVQGRRRPHRPDPQARVARPGRDRSPRGRSRADRAYACGSDHEQRDAFDAPHVI